MRISLNALRPRKRAKGQHRLAGFYGLSEADFGDPTTPEPYPRVTPTALAGVLLPFRCYQCEEVLTEFVDARARGKYRDKRPGKGYSWCPHCRARFYLQDSGMPLAAPLEPGVEYAPARVERDGQVEVIGGMPWWHRFLPTSRRRRGRIGLDLLGVK